MTIRTSQQQCQLVRIYQNRLNNIVLKRKAKKLIIENRLSLAQRLSHQNRIIIKYTNQAQLHPFSIITHRPPILLHHPLNHFLYLLSTNSSGHCRLSLTHTIVQSNYIDNHCFFIILIKQNLTILVNKFNQIRVKTANLTLVTLLAVYIVTFILSKLRLAYILFNLIKLLAQNKKIDDSNFF